MSREQDILFCKIAITAGLVKQEEAQKCFSLCERREQEGKRRPMIGAVFTRYNLMRNEEVRRVYEAVNKRLGKAGAAPRRNGGDTTIRKMGDTTIRRVGSTTIRKLQESAAQGRDLPAGRGGRRRAQRPQKLDRGTVMMGAGFGLIFLGVIATIVVLYIQSESRTSETASSEAVEAAPGGGGETAVMKASSTPTAPRVHEIAEAERKRLQAEAVDQVFLKQHKTALNDARLMAYGDNRPDMAVQGLKNHYNRFRTEYEHGAGHLKTEYEGLLKELEESAKGGGEEEEEESEGEEDLLDEES